ncbi:MAG: ectoine/hydroxyectoine ABC transporter ATP-binding protein EhuA [Candidatus Krumholzibacteriia bacterium]
MEPTVRFDTVCKAFDSVHVLRNLDLEVAPSEKLAVIGPSGSGKSTILRILMALETIDAGVVELCGETLWGGPAPERPSRADRARLQRLRRKVGMVFQHFNLFPHRTVLGNLTLAPRQVLGLSADEAESQARELLESVGLLEKANSYPADLSGGQKQRVAIARALAMQPEIMLFDEVTSALDPELVGEVLNVLRQLAREGRMTMILVTHQMNFAREIADRIVFMDEGQVIEQGSPDDILSNPRHERTRAFLSAVLKG